ncbi:MAG: hypothetical protein KBT67_05365 [bacterium]|nr:hypothetical protein [Candidatus Limimorpha caballi]
MKKVLLFITMAASLLFTQCKKEDSVPSAGRPVEMTVTVGQGGKTDITDMGAITWSAGDKLYVGDGSKYIGYLTLAGGVGTQTGTFTGGVGLTDADEGKELTFHFYYLGSADHTSLTKGAESVEVDFSSQDITKDGNGKLTNASLQHVCYGRANGTVIGGAVTDINVMMVSKVAIASFDFKNNGAAYTGALILRGDNIYNKMTVNFNSEGFACEGTKGEISLTNTTTSEKYVMLVPTNATTVSQSLTFAGGYVSGEATLENGIKPNKFYGLNGAIAVTLAVYKYVDLGLPSGLLWATCNVGANSPEKYGDYYQWGGVESVTSTDINVGWADCPLTNGTYSYDNEKVFTKYVPTGKTEYWAGSGDPDNKLVLDSEDDAAHEDWGDPWRMPTSDEWKELYDYTTRTWTTENGVYGRKFASKKDAAKYIFLPAAGYRDGTNVHDVGSFGYYWSGSLNSSYPFYAYYMYFKYDNVDPQNYFNRYYGYTVRPVRVAR